MDELIDLYHAVNEMMIYLGAQGKVTTRDKVSLEVMRKLYAIDGGVHNGTLGNENQ